MVWDVVCWVNFKLGDDIKRYLNFSVSVRQIKAVFTIKNCKVYQKAMIIQ